MSMTAQLQSRYRELKDTRDADELRRKQEMRDRLVQAFLRLAGEPPERVEDDHLLHEGMVFRYSDHWHNLELRVSCPCCHEAVWVVVRDFDALALLANDHEALVAGLPAHHREGRCRMPGAVRLPGPRPGRNGAAAAVAER